MQTLSNPAPPPPAPSPIANLRARTRWGGKWQLPVPRTTAAAAAAAAIGPYAVRGMAGKEGTGVSGALWLHGELTPPQEPSLPAAKYQAQRRVSLVHHTGHPRTTRGSAQPCIYWCPFAQQMFRGLTGHTLLSPQAWSSCGHDVEKLNQKWAIADTSCHSLACTTQLI